MSSAVTLEKRMLNIQELTEYTGISRQTVYNQLSAGTFPIKTKRLGRRLAWDRREVDRFLDQLPAIN